MAWILEKTQGYIFRKLIHLVLNVTLAYLAYLLSPEKLFPMALVIFLAVTAGELIRLKSGAKDLLNGAIEPMLKRKERKKLTGVFWGAAAGLMVSPIVSPQAMSFALAVFAVSDPAAALVGKHSKSANLYQRKTVNGSFAFFFASMLAALFYVFLWSLSSASFIWILFFAALLTLVEIFCDPVDDNFLIIVFAALFAHNLL